MRFRNIYPEDSEWTAFIVSLNKWTPENYQIRELVHYIQSGPHHPAAFYTELIEQLMSKKAQRALKVVKLTLRGEDPEQYRPADLVSMGLIEETIRDTVTQLKEETGKKAG